MGLCIGEIFCISSCIASEEVVTVQLGVIVLVEEGNGENADEWAGRAER